MRLAVPAAKTMARLISCYRSTAGLFRPCAGARLTTRGQTERNHYCDIYCCPAPHQHGPLSNLWRHGNLGTDGILLNRADLTSYFEVNFLSVRKFPASTSLPILNAQSQFPPVLSRQSMFTP